MISGIVGMIAQHRKPTLVLLSPLGNTLVFASGSPRHRCFALPAMDNIIQ